MNLPQTNKPLVLDWLHKLVGVQLGQLAAKGLRGTPAGTIRDGAGKERSVFELTIVAWVKDIATYYRELEPGDAARLEEGFAVLSTRVRFWPQSADLWPHVPQRTEPERSRQFGTCGCGAPFGDSFHQRRGRCAVCSGQEALPAPLPPKERQAAEKAARRAEKTEARPKALVPEHISAIVRRMKAGESTLEALGELERREQPAKEGT